MKFCKIEYLCVAKKTKIISIPIIYDKNVIGLLFSHINRCLRQYNSLPSLIL